MAKTSAARSGSMRRPISIAGRRYGTTMSPLFNGRNNAIRMMIGTPRKKSSSERM
jgi:hypothetical protein